MKEILELMRAPVFWFSSVAVAIAMNVLATYLTRWLDRKILFVRAKFLNRKRPSAAATKWAGELSSFMDSQANGSELLYGQSLTFRAQSGSMYLIAFSAGILAMLLTPVQMWSLQGWVAAAFVSLAVYAAIWGIVWNNAADAILVAIESHQNGLLPLKQLFGVGGSA